MLTCLGYLFTVHEHCLTYNYRPRDMFAGDNITGKHSDEGLQ